MTQESDTTPSVSNFVVSEHHFFLAKPRSWREFLGVSARFKTQGKMHKMFQNLLLLRKLQSRLDKVLRKFKEMLSVISAEGLVAEQRLEHIISVAVNVAALCSCLL